METGLPGRANTAVPDGATPNHSGLPGRCATLWNTTSTPRSASAAGTRSKRPIDTPPLRMRTSALSRWARSRSLERPGVVEHVVVDDVPEPVLLEARPSPRRRSIGGSGGRGSAARLHELVAGGDDRDASAAGPPAGWPGPRTPRWPRPEPDRRVPAASRTRSPWRASVPRRWTLAHGATSRSAASSTLASEVVICSTGTTASQPIGSTAPVITSMQSASEASCAGGSPAAWVASSGSGAAAAHGCALAGPHRPSPRGRTAGSPAR